MNRGIKILWGACILAILIIIGLFIKSGLFLAPKKKPLSPPQNQAAANPQAGSQFSEPAVENYFLSTYGKITFPAVGTEQPAKTSAVLASKNLQGLVLSQAVKPQWLSVNYQDGEKGFLVSYVLLPSDYVNSFDQLVSGAQNLGWNILAAQRTAAFAFMDAQAGGVSMRLKQVLGKDNVETTIQTLEK